MSAKPPPRVPRGSKPKMELGSGTVIILAENLMGNSVSSNPKFSKPGTSGTAEKTLEREAALRRAKNFSLGGIAAVILKVVLYQKIY